MIYKRNIFQKAVSLLLTVSLLVPGMGATARAEAPVEPVEKPQLRVVGTLTDGGKYLELGLSIDGKAASFQSAGVLLKYDATKLTPLKWGAIEDESGVPADAKTPVSSATTVETAWNKATVLPTKSKGADDLVGKTAKVVKLSESATSAYLFLSAEAPKGRTLRQLLPVETGTAPEGLPTATASGKPITAIGAADAPADQVVTVRFLVGTTTDAGEGAVERNYTLAELVATIDLVVYDPTSATPDANERALLLASPLTLSTNVNTKLEGLSYIADNTDYTTAGFTTAADVSFLWVAAGQTVDSGKGGSAEDFASVVFYDFDDRMLGSIVVKKGEDATEAIEKFQTEQELDKLHAGYRFGCWIPYSSDTPTTYGTRVQSGNANLLAVDNPMASEVTKQLREPLDKVNFANVTGNLVIKAAYVANEASWLTSNATSRQYTVTPQRFTRYGTAGVVSIIVQIERKNAANEPVPRPAKPALRVAMTANNITTYSLYPLKGADLETVEIVPFGTLTGGVTKLEWAVIDNYGVSNWITAAGTRLNTTTSIYTRGNSSSMQLDGMAQNVLLNASQTYLYSCYIGWISDVCAAHDRNTLNFNDMAEINFIQLRSIGISVTGAGTAVVVREKIYEAWFAKNSADGVNLNNQLMDLTKREITEALGTTANSIFSPGE